jgi:hypothetical protein
MRRAVFLAATFVLGTAGSARAESRSVRIDYEAVPSCPDERRFVELARDRVREWATIDERGELVARARTEKLNGAFVGRLSLEDAAGGASLGERTIQDADCEEVVLALALFLAVALEAEATHPRAPASTVAETPPVEHRVDVRRAANLPPRPPPAQKGDASAIRWGLAARAHGVTGRMPGVAAGAALAIELGPRWTSALRPFGGVGVDVVPYSERSEGRGHVELGWGAVFGRVCAGLDVSGRRTSDDRGWIEPWACARVEAGGLRAASRGYAVNRTEYLPWYAAGAEAGVALRLSQLISVGAFLHAAAPIVRHELVLGDLRVFRAPILTGEAGLELKVRIW